MPLSEIQNGDVGPNEMPHALTRSGSVSLASPGMFETRFVRSTLSWALAGTTLAEIIKAVPQTSYLLHHGVLPQC